MTGDPGAQVRESLDATGVAYEVMDCDPELADTAVFCEHYGVPVEQSANTILVAGKPRGGGDKVYVACVVLAHTRLDVNNAVRHRLDVKKASFASADETRELTGMLIGGVTAAALPDGMPLWVDARVMDAEWIVLGGGDRSTKIKAPPAVLTALGARGRGRPRHHPARRLSRLRRMAPGRRSGGNSGVPSTSPAGIRTRLLAAPVLVGAAVLVLAGPVGAAVVAETTEAVGSQMTWGKAAVLGVVEGITEFLPISSTGHLLVASRLLDLPSEEGSAGLEALNAYAIAIQFGAILAVVALFWRRFVEMLQGLAGRNPDGRHLFVILVIAFIPSALLGALFDDPIEDALFGPGPVVVAWIIGGALILILQRTGHIPRGATPDAPERPRLTDITHRQALIIGLAQCAALWPGTSRSLATIIGALLVGVAMPAAVEFSFLLGFATLTAATAFTLLKDGGTLVDEFGIADPLVGALFAFGSALLAIRWLVGYLKGHDLSIFAWYRFVVAGLTIALLATSTI